VNRSTRVNLALVSGRQFVGKQFWKFSDSLLAVAPGIGIAENRFWGGGASSKETGSFFFCVARSPGLSELMELTGLVAGLTRLVAGLTELTAGCKGRT